MEDGFGTIVYVIITIIALVITVLGKKRKRKQGPVKAPVTRNIEAALKDPFEAFDLLEKELDAFTEEETITDIPEEPVRNELGMIIEEGVSALAEGALGTEHELEELKKEMQTDDPEHTPPEELLIPYIEISDMGETESDIREFNLRQAVIMSEILNRRY